MLDHKNHTLFRGIWNNMVDDNDTESNRGGWTTTCLCSDSEESVYGPEGVSLRGALEAGGPWLQGGYPSGASL